MIEKYVPDIYQKSIYYINYDKLYKKGIRCIIFDLDNTISPPFVKKPTKRLKKLFDELKDKGFKIIINFFSILSSKPNLIQLLMILNLVYMLIHVLFH